jgi:chloramphenicol 3-O-phosphotransferase
MRNRRDTDQAEREQVWHETPPLDSPDLAVDTSTTTPHEIAAQVDQLVRGRV